MNAFAVPPIVPVSEILNVTSLPEILNLAQLSVGLEYVMEENGVNVGVQVKDEGNPFGTLDFENAQLVNVVLVTEETDPSKTIINVVVPDETDTLVKYPYLTFDPSVNLALSPIDIYGVPSPVNVMVSSGARPAVEAKEDFVQFEQSIHPLFMYDLISFT
jgi:hypothetical protein